MKAQYYIVGAYSDQRYQKAQVAVCPNSEDLNGGQMPDVARELNQQECVFVKTSYRGNSHYEQKGFSITGKISCQPP